MRYAWHMKESYFGWKFGRPSRLWLIAFFVPSENGIVGRRTA